MYELSRPQLTELKDNARVVLEELVTPDAIYASSNMGGQGQFHGKYGRDEEITQDFQMAAAEFDISTDRSLLEFGWSALAHSVKFMGRRSNPATGEQPGAGAHVVRKFKEGDDTPEVQRQYAAETNERPWFVDPDDGLLKNWDTADAPALWILAVLRGQRRFGLEVSTEMEDGLRATSGWIIARTEQYDGLVGFTGADEQPGRVYSGLRNQGWKDTTDIYQTPDGENAPHPIKDVLVNAESWAALRDAAEYFAARDAVYSKKLRETADVLQRKFNDDETGFVLKSRKGLAQAIDGDGNRLEQRAVDQGAVLWARTLDGEVIVDPGVATDIAEEMTSPEMFNPEAGIRNYALGTEFSHGTRYHGSSHTFWPFMSGMVARGLEQMGETEKAEKIMHGMLNAVYTLGTNIEMFVQNEQDEFEPWSHPDPDIGQMSSREQAWTAGAVYYATSYILSTEKQDTGGTQ